MPKLAEYLTILAMITATVVYAENQYAKTADIQTQIQTMQVQRWQERIDILSNLKEHQGLTPEQRWELKYFSDKKQNLLQSKGR